MSELSPLEQFKATQEFIPCGIKLVGNTTLTKEAIRESMVRIFVAMLGTLEKVGVHIETMHHFLPGLYVRTVHMKAGDLIVGKVHKKDHMIIISAGSALVISEEMGPVEITAPAIFPSKAGSFRTLFVREDMVWTTVHQTSNTEVAAVEEELLEMPECYIKAMQEMGEVCRDGSQEP